MILNHNIDKSYTDIYLSEHCFYRVRDSWFKNDSSVIPAKFRDGLWNKVAPTELCSWRDE